MPIIIIIHLFICFFAFFFSPFLFLKKKKKSTNKILENLYKSSADTVVLALKATWPCPISHPNMWVDDESIFILVINTSWQLGNLWTLLPWIITIWRTWILLANDGEGMGIYLDNEIQCKNDLTLSEFWIWIQSSVCPTPRLMMGKFLLTYSVKREKRGKEKKTGNGAEKKENWKRDGGKLKKEGGKVTEWGEFFFSFLFFSFFFFFAFHFSKPLKFVLGLPKWVVSTGKKHFTQGKKSGKMTLPLLKNIPLMSLTKMVTEWHRLINHVINKLNTKKLAPHHRTTTTCFACFQINVQLEVL